MLYIFFVVNTYLIPFKMIICICSNAISEANFREFKVLLNLNILGGGGTLDPRMTRTLRQLENSIILFNLNVHHHV